jgi:hypothetical protein
MALTMGMLKLENWFMTPVWRFGFDGQTQANLGFNFRTS